MTTRKMVYGLRFMNLKFMNLKMPTMSMNFECHNEYIYIIIL
jgi:hypothetical protein